jgi:uncharacterized protein YukE
MRVILLLALIVLRAPATAHAYPAATDTFDATCRAAMANYYAALLTSVHGDSEATLRQLLLLRARWEEVARLSRSGNPDWTQDATTGESPVAAVTAMIERARQRTSAGDIAGAHAELEGIRAVLRDGRARHGVRTFDDVLTDYHDAMERLTSRVGLRNEIALNAEDYDAIREQTARADAAWTEIKTVADPVKMRPVWGDMATRTTAALATVQRAAAAQDAAAAQGAAAALKTHYFELLRILSRG